MRQGDLENPMVIGDYYAICSECGGLIYAGDYFHTIGRGSGARKLCENCTDLKEDEREEGGN